MTTRISVLIALALCASCSSARIDPMEYDYYSSGYAAPDATEPSIEDINAQPANSNRSDSSTTSDPAPVAPAAAAPAQIAGTVSHRIRKGDNLYALSRQYLGTGRRWREIADLNGLSDSDVKRLAVGREIQIPAR